MNGDQPLSVLYLLLLLVFVGSALAVRRMPMDKTLKLAAVWIAIFALGFAIFYFLVRP